MQQEASFPSHSGTTLVTRLTNVAKSRFVPIFWLLLILMMAGWFRFTGLDWDEEKHLHPDERFLTMVTAAMEWPESFDNYFDPLQSELSPYRNDPEVWYVYGTLPIMITKWVSTVVEMEGYDKVYLVGRALSGILDLGCILFIFLIGQRLYDDKVGLLGAGLYALAVHPIQLSHFYAVDTFANFFVVMTIYWAVRASEKGNWWFYVLMGISLGAGMASKLSVVTLGVVVLLAGLLDFARFYRRTADVHSSLEHLLARWATVGILLLVVFRVLQPIAFEGPSFFNFRFSEIWLDDIDQMKKMVEGVYDIPPFVQWAYRDTFMFPLRNIVLWGLGIPLGLAAWGGWLLGGYHILRHRNTAHLLPVAYIGVTFVYHSLQWVKYMRYFMPIYPLLALMAGYLIMWLWRQAWQPHDQLAQPAQRSPRQQVWQRFLKGAAVLLAIVVPVGTLLYTLAFTSIYSRPVSRITASRWMYEHIPQGSVIANEHWDDDLPLRVDGKDGYRDWYSSVEIKNYDHYSPEKVDSLVNSLTEADYVSLSSNRLYDSVTRLPQRYPIATRYYQLLFAEELGFEKVAEFTSYPQLFGLELPDQSADESFTVYDHPKVMIFKKTEVFDPEKVRQLLTSDIDWYTYFHTTPRKMTLAPHGIMFGQEDRQLYQQYGTWSQMFTPENLANRVPLLVWALAIQLLGVLTFPLVWGVFHRLEDRGYIFAKAIGLLLVGWITWLLASWRVMLFTRTTLLLALLLVVIASVIVVALRYREIGSFLRHRWRLLLLQEGVFWLFFALFAFLRWHNPDIGSAYESRASFDYLATLNAMIKTPYFPAYDPWYAGGFLNGSYFGLVLVAVLVKLTGILPEVAYNLALPTWAALAVGGIWSVAFHLAQGWRETWYAAKPKLQAEGSLSGALLAGGLAVLFVMLFGNLNLVHFLLNLEGSLDFNKYLEVTRIIPKVPSEPELITTFPFFAFIHGELQAHILALPYLLLVMMLAVHTIRVPMPSSNNPATDMEHEGETTKQSHPWYAQLRRLLPQVANEAIVLVPLALATGALALLNHVDWFVGVVLVVAALAIRLYHQREQEQATLFTQYRQKRHTGQRSWSLATLPVPARLRWQSRPISPPSDGESRRWNAPTPDVVALMLSLLWRVIVVVGLGKLLFYPFHATYAPLIDGIQRWEGEHVPLSAFLVINGFFLFILGTFLVQEIWQPRQNALVRLLRMFWRYWQRIPRVWQRYEALVQPGVWFELGLYAVLFPVALIILLVLFKLWTIAAVALILLVTVLLLVRPFATPQRQFTLGLIALGCGIMLFSEVAMYKEFEAFIKDPYRQLTIFISYFQVWVIWGIASAVALMVLIERLPVFFSAIERGGVQSAIERLPVVSWLVAQVWWLLLIVLVVASLHYPLFGTVNLLQKQATTEQKPTFDSMAYMQQERYTHFGFDFSLQPDYEAIRWMREHIPGSPIIAEATHPQETWAGRVSVYTGLPVIVGWRDAVQYRRSLLPGNRVDDRQRDLEAIYLDADPDVARSLLKKHAVSYVYVGPLERQVFRGVGVEKFSTYAGEYWDLVYENAAVQIYRVLDDG